MNRRSNALWLVTIAMLLGHAPRALAQDAGTPAPAPEDRDAPRDPAAPESPDAPWGGASDVELPSFLDTTDSRVQDNRPPPTPEQLEALRALEAEVGRFTQSGETYRDTVVSLVRREYLRQRRSRD